MSEQSEQVSLKVKVIHPPIAKEYLLVVDLRDAEGQPFKQSKMRAAEAIRLLFKVGVPEAQFVVVSEAEKANLKLKPIPSFRHDTTISEIVG
jgi:hypothetical protein